VAIRACYVPLNHKTGIGDLLGGGMADGQIPLRAALERLKPLLEDPAVLKVAQNLKYDWLVIRRHGITVRVSTIRC
jgi:DNA polymerase-1